MNELDLRSALDAVTPPFDDSDADWEDALRRGGFARRRTRVVAAVAVAVGAAALAAITPAGQALVGGAFERLASWADGAPGEPAPRSEQEALRAANARAAAPIPADTELGVLTRASIDGESFELLGFEDRGSLCLRLRTTARDEVGIVKAPADCVLRQLLVDLRKPLAVVSAANPFPQNARAGVQALYGFAADGVAAVELETEHGARRVPVANNAFLYAYEGASPRSAGDGLVYESDVPSRATALDAHGGELGSVEIASLKRGYPGAPAASALPGPARVERVVESARVGWLERGEERGRPYEFPRARLEFRMFHPNASTSMRVIVARDGNIPSASGVRPGYCLTHLWPLQRRPRGFICAPLSHRGPFAGPLTLAIGTTQFEDQFPVHYGIASDAVASLRLFLANGRRQPVALVDNVFAFQAPRSEPTKLVGYDEQGRVVAIHVTPL